MTANQAFALRPQLGMQCHVELTPDMVEQWCASGARGIARSQSPAVPPAELIKADLAARVATLNRVAGRVHARWSRGLG